MLNYRDSINTHNLNTYCIYNINVYYSVLHTNVIDTLTYDGSS